MWAKGPRLSWLAFFAEPMARGTPMPSGSWDAVWARPQMGSGHPRTTPMPTDLRIPPQHAHAHVHMDLCAPHTYRACAYLLTHVPEHVLAETARQPSHPSTAHSHTQLHRTPAHTGLRSWPDP